MPENELAVQQFATEDIPAAAEALDEINETGTQPEAYRYAELRGEKEPFRIDSDSRANWALRQIAAARAEHARMAAQYREEIDRLKDMMDDEDKRLERKIAWLTTQLDAYSCTVDMKESKGKTRAAYRLAYGNLIRKTGGEDFRLDDDLLIPWLERNAPGCVNKTCKWAKLKAELDFSGGAAITKITGEIVPGVTVVRKPDTFTIEFTKEALT